ncbi:hypothetical protein [Micrococcus luteus]|uniref:hypothetical protein n=1 Tax=Micrococcus luteus TaxID=1270 RepID=UPI00333043D5
MKASAAWAPRALLTYLTNWRIRHARDEADAVAHLALLLPPEHAGREPYADGRSA